MRFSKEKVSDYIFILLLFLTPIIQWTLTWSMESKFTIDIFDYNIFYTEIFIIYILMTSIIRKRSLIQRKIYFFLILALSLSFLSSIINKNDYWFLNFIVSLDFIFYGFLFCSFNLNNNHVRMIKIILLFFFFYISSQQILVSLGVINVETTHALRDFAGVYRTGTTIGSSISSGYFIIIISGILCHIHTSNKKLCVIVKSIAFVAVLLTLSRGPILTLFIVTIFEFRKKVFNSFSIKRVFIFFIMIFILFQLNNYYNALDIIYDRFKSEDVTSGRDDRWDSTIEIYKDNSLLFGAGNNLIPLQRSILSNAIRPAGKTSSPHNFYLSYLVEIGIFGFLIILFLMIYLIKITIKTSNINIYSKLIFLMLPVTYANLELILRDGLHAYIFWLYFFILVSQKNDSTVTTNLHFKNLGYS